MIPGDLDHDLHHDQCPRSSGARKMEYGVWVMGSWGAGSGDFSS